MKKGLFIASIILTILNIFATVYCAILNAGIVYEGEGAIGLIVIIPYSFILMPIILALGIVALIFSLKSRKSESNAIRLFSIIVVIINIIILVALTIMFGRLIPVFNN